MRIFGHPVGREKRELEAQRVAQAKIEREWIAKVRKASYIELSGWLRQIKSGTISVSPNVKELINDRYNAFKGYKKSIMPMEKDKEELRKDRKKEIEREIARLESELGRVGVEGSSWTNDLGIRHFSQTSDQKERMSYKVDAIKSRLRELKNEQIFLS